MNEPDNAGKYQVGNDGTTQGQVIGDNPIVHQHFYGPQDKTISSTKPQRVWNVPYLRNDYFTGREEILAQLHTRFKANNATALSQRHAMSGLGGIGKTQTAVEYTYRYHQEYQAVLWARAESRETLTSSFVEIAVLLDLPQKDEQDQTLTVNAVRRWLQSNDGWLLILDNADEPAIVREFLPTKCDGHTLLTTRAQALGGLAQRIEVDTFTPELGALFLLRRATIIGADDALELATSEDRELAIEISEELGGLPLALDQAGAYIEETQSSLSDYLGLYRTRRAEMLKERGGLTGDHPEPVATTWSLSFQRVEERDPAAADLLRFCAFLAPDAIPEEIITAGTEHLGPLLQAAANDPIALNKAIAALGAYSLIRRDPAEKTLSIHRLVQAVLRDAMTAEEVKVWAERIVQAMNAVFPDVDYETWFLCERLLPLALSAIEQHITFEGAGRLLFVTASYLLERARYAEAEPLFQQTLRIREQQLGSEHPDMATSLYSLARLYLEQGKYTEAEPLFQQTLRIREQQLGPEHPDMADPLNGLAVLYKEQGKYDKAEPLYQKAVHIEKQHLGPEHPNLATTLNNLALLYSDQGKYEKAEPLYQQALRIWEQQSAPEHPNMAYPLNNLALLYWKQGKYAEAEPLYQQALRIWEQQLGPEHPNVAYPLNNLARLYLEQSRYGEAEPLFQRALYIREQQLGPEHPNVAYTLNNLAILYSNQGKYTEAKSFFRRALRICEQSLGSEHPQVALSLNGLATLHCEEGKYAEAKPLYQRALHIREQALGPQHPDTAETIHNLAQLFDVQGNNEEARSWYTRALAIHEQALGPQHPNTQQARQNYANLLRAMGRDEEAKQLEEGNES